MNYYEIITKYIDNFNKSKRVNLTVDTIRINFNKDTKLYRLEYLGKWHKVKSNSKISSKLKKRLLDDEITSAYQLDDYNIYYFNSQNYPKYRNATMVIFGLSQYKGKTIPNHQINEILAVLNDITNIDVCFDFDHKPNIDEVNSCFAYTNYRGYNQTYYYNNPKINLIEKFYIYNKAFSNNLKGILWRIEFKVLIENIKDLHLPLDEIKNIIALAQKCTINSKINAKGRNV